MTALAAAALIAGCGGGTEQIDPFKPTRIIAFGDESSVILDTGKKYGINRLNTDTKLLDCTQNPNWVQMLASNYGMVFRQCNVNGVALPQGIMYAEAGFKVADVVNKIDLHLSNDRFWSKDLVTVMVGMNDILELYRQFPAQGRDALINEATARGKLLAQQVNRIANAGGRVLITTLFELGDTPFGQNEKLLQTDTDRAVFLNDLSTAFNTAMRLNLLNDGRLIGLVLVDETMQQIVRYPSAFSFTDVTHQACRADIAAQDCTSDTLQSDASETQWLWAGDHYLGPTVQQRIGSMAITRAQNNPF